MSVLFLSDFDGTMTHKDFYLTFVENYLEEFDKVVLEKCLRGEITSYEYLDEILSKVDLSKEEIDNHVEEMQLVYGVRDLITAIRKVGGEFVVVSAGSSYYIKPNLQKLDCGEILLFSNGGEFSNRGISMSYPVDDSVYGSYYGINKEAVFEKFEKKYKTIIYAGDGASDFEAAKRADIRFARGALANKLKMAKVEYYEFIDFYDILDVLNQTFLNK